jgi:hypothetical protein
MIEIIGRGSYNAYFIKNEGKVAAKLYIHNSGLISNLYVRKNYRGNPEVLKEVLLIIETASKSFEMLYGYASPKGTKTDSRRKALIRLYSRYGFINTNNNKVVKRNQHE